MRLAAGVALVVWLCTGAGWSQMFADGFESGDTSMWSQTYFGGTVISLPGGVTMAFKVVPPGMFFMGSPADERGRLDREDLHEVTLSQAYYLARYEVTQAQWEAVTGVNPSDPANGPQDCPWGGDFGFGPSNPVYCVSWSDIAEPGGFVNQLNAYLSSTGQMTGFRLPTEAEWERGARAGTQTRFSHGDVLECGDLCEACPTHDLYMWWCGSQPYEVSQPVGSRLQNAFGLNDMHGNVDELVQDWYAQHLGTDPITDPSGPGTGTLRVGRGGDWEHEATGCRSASRLYYDLDLRDNLTGFRLAKTAP